MSGACGTRRTWRAGVQARHVVQHNAVHAHARVLPEQRQHLPHLPQRARLHLYGHAQPMRGCVLLHGGEADEKWSDLSGSCAPLAGQVNRSCPGGH